MTTPIADWLPPALREGPGGASDPERLLDLLLAAVDEQVALLARDIDQVYDDLFIESCADWAVPYIGSLLGLPADATRLEVANTIALRRRKGTPAALEDFAEVVSAWTARVTDGWQITACTHMLDHPLGPRATVFGFDDAARARIGTPFDRSQRVASPEQGIVPHGVQIAIWPWTVYSHVATEVAPTAVADRFALHPLGVECPIFLRPRPLEISRSPGQGRTTDEFDAPVRATYRVIEVLAAPGEITIGTNWQIADTHVLADDDPLAMPPLLRLSAIDTGTGNRVDVPWAQLRFGGLPTGAAAPQPPAAGQIVVDVHRGLIEVGAGWQGPVRATWHRAVSGEMGALPGAGGVDDGARVVVTVNPDAVAGPTVRPTLTQAINAAENLSAALDPAGSRPGRPDVEIRLMTSDRLAAPNAPVLDFAPTLPRWRIIAPALLTPTIAGNLNVALDGGCIELEGFQITGHITIGADVTGVALKNVTMDPTAPSTVRVVPAAWGVEVAIDRCVTGPVRAELGARSISISNSIVDGVGAALVACGTGPPPPPATQAVGPTGAFPPMIQATGVTFHGPVEADSVDATDCLFAHGLAVTQTQAGCLRFCYIGNTPDEDLPVTHRCLRAPAPAFASVEFESPQYLTLPLTPASVLHTASSTGGALGAYAHVRASARLGRLHRRIGEFVPMGLEPRLIVAKGET
jgi:hypothetical protein